MGRLTGKALLLLLLLSALLVLYWAGGCGTGLPSPPVPAPAFSDLTCQLNREVGRNIGLLQAGRRLHCKTDGKEVFVPFSWLASYYETRGELVGSGDTRAFEISHSYSKVYKPQVRYSAAGEFMHFKQFSVESRSRVVAVSAGAGVPVSNQWDPAGYFYPTQIAQFALSHYSSYIATSNKDIKKTVIEDAHHHSALDSSVARRVVDTDTRQLVVEYRGNMRFQLDSSLPVLCLDFKPLDEDAAFDITVETRDSEEDITLSFRPVEEFFSVTGSRAVFGFGSDKTGSWVRLTRHLMVDLDKVLKQQGRGRSAKRAGLRIREIKFSGHAQVTNITLSGSEHLRQFYHGADWFLQHQDSRGGWPSQVTFNKGSKKYPGAEEIKPGWYGAMCQGQAMSVLVRAFLHCREERYLAAAQRALGPFTASSNESGVRAEFPGGLPWYEEYPTNPPTFILNGFMYSLLGLSDLASATQQMGQEGEVTTPAGQSDLAGDLYRAGLSSLLTLLPLYDSGSGTFYDLRHFTMKTAPKGARWDYHSTHINQLLVLATLEPGQPQLRETAERWRGYMVGLRAPHN